MIAIDGSTLLSYYSAQRNLALARSSSASASSSSSSSDSTSSTTPWQESSSESSVARDAEIMTMTEYVDDSDVPLVAVSDEEKLEQDNQKLYAIYKALDNLQYLASMAARDDVTDGQITGYNNRFQDCLSQIQEYLENTEFNNLELQQAAVEAVTAGTATISSNSYGYTTETLATSDNINEALSGIDTGDSFNITVTKNGTDQTATIDMAAVAAEYGTLSLSNIVSYANAQLESIGVNTRLSRVQTGTETDEDGNITYNYGLKIQYASSEAVTLSSNETSSSLYITGTSGLTSSSTNETTDSTTAANNQTRLAKLTLTGEADETTSVFSVNTVSSSGTSEAVGSVTDDEGNSYVLGTTSGDIDGEINQGTQDVYLSKYDSAGNLLWSHLIGSSGEAEGYSIALDPTGGVVVAGSTTADLTTTVATDNENSFVAKFSANGSEEWVTQLSTRSDNAATSVSVDADGTITVGGTISGVVASGETNAGKSDAYLLQLDSSGTITARQQFGSSGDDEVAATAYGDDGSLYVVSVENNIAYLSKYAVDEDGNVDITGDATWKQELGTIGSSGSIGDILVSDDKIYISGASRNDIGGEGGISGEADAFVISLSDTGDAATTNYVSYVGTSGTETAGALAMASDGTIYLTGSTEGTFDGQTRNVEGTTNAFVSAIDSATGEVSWTKQFGGNSGQSTGVGIAIVENNSSVLDALGLPTGTVQVSSAVSSLLTDETTLKAGDTFKITINTGSSTRTTTITIDEDETLRSLVGKINDKLGDAGEASISYTSGGKTLEISSASGYSLTLVSGDSGADALAGLGIDAGTLTDGTVVSSSSDTKTVYGLGLSSSMELSSASEAAAVKVEVKSVMKTIQEIYSKINSGDSDEETETTSSSSTLSSALSSYYDSRNLDSALALSLLA